MFVGIKKQKISAYHVFRKYRLKTFYSGTNFSSLLNFRLITAQSIFVVEPRVWSRWKGPLTEKINGVAEKWNHPKTYFW
jgi:hypothetical protein